MARSESLITRGQKVLWTSPPSASESYTLLESPGVNLSFRLKVEKRRVVNCVRITDQPSKLFIQLKHS